MENEEITNGNTDGNADTDAVEHSSNGTFQTGVVPHTIISLSGFIVIIFTAVSVLAAYFFVTWLLIASLVLTVAGASVYLIAASKDRLKGRRRGKLPPLVKFIAIQLLIVAFLYVMFRAGFQVGLERGRESFIPATPTNVTRAMPDGRVLLVDMTPEFLDFLYRENTHIEATRRMEPYWNKWLIFDGPVVDVRNRSDKETSIMIRRPEPFSPQTVYFQDPRQIERLQPLAKGNPAKVLCKIEKDSIDFTFTACELQDN